MLNPNEFSRIRDVFPFLKRADPKLIHDFRQTATYARIPAGQDVFVEGDQVLEIALIISGIVRVYKIGENGREITIYRFGHGQSCILTANAILSRQSFPAIATVEQAVAAAILPAEIFREWVRIYDPWREYVFSLYSQRLFSIMTLVDEVAFRRMDRRVAALLVSRGRIQNPIRITHQDIAAELGSSREVISRLLEDLTFQGLIRSGRGSLEILDFESLESRSIG